MNLRAFLREGSSSLRGRARRRHQVADALDYSHAQGVVHRDVKPENMMVCEEDGQLRARVMDFGLARARGREPPHADRGRSSEPSRTSARSRSPAPDIDARTDIYALGTVLYECVAGEPPFTGERAGDPLPGRPRDPSPLRALGALIAGGARGRRLAGLAKDPAKRHQRAADLAVAIEPVPVQDSAASEEDRRSMISRAVTAQYARPPVSRFVGREKEFAELQRG